MSLTVIYHSNYGIDQTYQETVTSPGIMGMYEIWVEYPPAHYGLGNDRHTFLYWATNSDGSGNKHYCDDDHGISIITGPVGEDNTVDLYAIWEPLINKVVYGSHTLLDLTGDTVTPSDLVSGVTAHAANGERITGTLNTYTKSEIDDLLAAKQDAGNYIENGTSEDVAFGGTASFGGNVAVGAGKLLKVVDVALSVSVASGDNTKSVSKTAAQVQTAIGTGWTALCCIPAKTGSYLWYFTQTELNSGALEVSISRRSAATSADKINPHVRIICVRTSL